MNYFKFALVTLLMFCCTAQANPLTTKIKQLQYALFHERQQDTDLHQQLKATEMTLATLAQDIAHITQLQVSEQLELTHLQKKQQDEQTRLSRQRDTLANQVRAAYELGKLNEIKILLNQENSNTLSRHLGYYRYLTQKRVELINESKQTLLSLTQTMQAITQHQQELQHLLAQKQQQQKKQEFTQKLRQQLIAQLNFEVQTKQQQLSALLENQQGLQNAIDQIQKQPVNITAAYQPFSKQQGNLPWPATGNIIGHFGTPIDESDQHLAGVIIKAPLGSPIRAISSGKVVFANWLRGFGLLVIIDHGGGYMSLYGRNQALYTKLGNKVKSGDLIAAIGNTGGYQSSSLYFEIRQNGTPVNPSLWCRKT